ncbi:MAG: AAA family ATPase, partial [Bacteroidales bacterium]|nr:AAA family ATPase [Bacteroidales bacterium]
MEKLYLRHKNLLSTLKTKYESSLIKDIPWDEQLVGITGARGVGKTTLMLQYIKKTYGYDRKVLYLSMDDIAFSYPTLVDLAEDFLKTGGKQLFIDEIHKYENWAQELKNIFDFYPQLKVVFTGSSILDIYKGQADLSRRALIFNMNGLSFREFLQIESKQQFSVYTLKDIAKNHESISLEISQKVKVFKYWNDYLHHGYYPFYLKDKKYYHVRLSSSLNQIVETDMPLLLNVNPQYVSKIKRLVNILANEIPVKPNISELASAI